MSIVTPILVLFAAVLLIGLAREPGMSAPAEGFETEGWLKLLQSSGWRDIQGNRFAWRPPAHDLEPLLRLGRVNLTARAAA